MLRLSERSIPAWVLALMLFAIAIAFAIDTFILSRNADVPAVERSVVSVSADAAAGDLSAPVINGLIDRIATERAARLVAEERLRELQEENDRLRR